MNSTNNQSTVQNEVNEYNFKINTKVECTLTISTKEEITLKI